MPREKQSQATTSTVRAADGTRIRWTAEGEGIPLVFCNGLANTAFQWGTVRRRLRGQGRLVFWDYPGHGESEPARSHEALEMPGVVDTLARVIDAAVGPDTPVVLLGYSLGCQVALEAWRTQAHRIAGLVFALGTSGKPFDTFYGPVRGRLAHGILRTIPGPVFAGCMKITGVLGPISHASSKLSGTTERGIAYADFAPFFEHLQRIDHATFHAMSLAAQRHSAEDLLPSVQVPALVVAGGKDVFTPPEQARGMDAQLPDSELVYLPRASHAGLVGHGPAIADAVEGFLVRRELI